MTDLQINFIQRAVENYRQTILEELFGVPDEISDIPDWAHSEINDLMKALYGAIESKSELCNGLIDTIVQFLEKFDE